MTKRRGVRCSEVCCVWDTYDKDCDIMGENHLHPRICPIFKEQDADLWKKLDGMSFVDKSGCVCVWFDGEPDLDTIVHESVHLANMVIERTGMTYSPKEDELLAYLVSYIFNELRGKND